MKFALYFANRGFFPETLVAKARKEMEEAVRPLVMKVSV